VKFQQNDKENSIPGPGSYNNDRSKVLSKSSAWKIGSAVRRNLHYESHTPGTGQYTPSLRNEIRPAGCVFGHEKRPDTVPLSHQITPSPASYHVPLKTFKETRTVTNAKRDIDLDKKNNYPGVGQYDLEAVMRATHTRASKCTFGRGKRDHSPFIGGKGKENMPGAGDYNDKTI